MPLYEHVFLARQDVSAQQVEKLMETFQSIITDNGGSVGKTEYWGLKNLAYRIKKKRKAHYALMNIDAPHAAVAEMERQMGIEPDVIRFMTLRVDELDDSPSAMMKRHDRDDRRGPRRDRDGRDGGRHGDRDGGRHGDRGGGRGGDRVPESKPAEAKQPAEVKAEKPEATSEEDAKPAEAKQPAEVKAEKPEAASEQDAKPTEAKQPAEVKAEEPEAAAEEEAKPDEDKS